MPVTPGLAIGVDLGATKIAAALISPDGQLLDSSQALTEASQGAEAVLDRITDQVSALLRRAAGPITGVGIGSPGQVNSQLGIVRKAVNLGWEEIYLSTEIQARLGYHLPVYIQKDTNLSALGEYYFGASRDCPDFVYLGIGSGLGGGIMSGGRLVTGADWNAAELGHLSLDPEGLSCACGSRGCAETIVSGPGLVNLTRRFLEDHRFASSLISNQYLSTTQILDAARLGDELARQALAQVGRHLGLVMASCIAVLNPGRFVIGGGLGLAAFDELVQAAWDELRQRTLSTSYQNLEIVPSQVESSAIGAACLVWYFQGEFITKEVIT